MKITIRRGDDTTIAPHFIASEFYSKQSTAPASHDFYSELVEAVSFLRQYYDTPWRITSTYRPDSIGSQHRECRAVDSQPTNMSQTIVLDLVAQLLNPTSEIFTQMRRLGINGFGVYDTFVHLDCRDTAKFPANHHDKFGPYAFWDERKKKVAAGTNPLLLKKLSPPKVKAAPISRRSSLSSPLRP